MAKKIILESGQVKTSDWFFTDNEEHMALLNYKKPCIYILSKFDEDMFRTYKPGYCEGASIAKPNRCVLDRISEQIHPSENLEKVKYVIEAIIPLPDDYIAICAKKGTIPDKYAHSIIECFYGFKPVPGNRNRYLEYYRYRYEDKTIDPIDLYNKIEYIVNNKGNVPFAENNTKIFPYELQSIETKKCVTSFINGSKEYLENAACRFGKTFMGFFVAESLYEYYKSKENLETDCIINDKIFMVLVYSIKCDVMAEWKSKCAMFGYAFICTDKSYGSLEEQYKKALESGLNKIVCFASVMDLYGKDADGNVKEKNKFIHNPPHHWNLAIGDEFHFGLHNRNAYKTFSIEDYTEEEIEAYRNYNRYNKPIRANHFLYMTATGYASISSGRFPDNFSIVTYADMKRYAEYYSIPKIKLVSIQHSEEALSEYIMRNNKNQFSLSKLFKAKKDAKGNYRFVHPKKVHRFLCYFFDIEDAENNCLYGGDYVDDIIANAMKHSIIVMDEIASCYALAEMIKKDFPFIGKKYYIHTVAGSESNAIFEKDVLIHQMNAISNGTDSNRMIGTITITCGKLLTGVSVSQWSAMLLFTSKTKAEFLHQSIGRLFTPHVDECGLVLKPYVVIIDPDPNRALYFRGTFDMMERTKNPNKSRRETYCGLEKLIEFISLNEKGVFQEISYEKMTEQRISNGKQIDYLRNNGFVIGNYNDIKNAVEKYGLDLIFTGRAIKKTVQSIQITSNPLIEPVTSQYTGTVDREENKVNYMEVLRKVSDTLGLFCFVYDDTIETFNDLKKVPNDIIKKYFKVGIDVLEDLFEKSNVISLGVFEDMLDIYNTGNKLLTNSVKEYLCNVA